MQLHPHYCLAEGARALPEDPQMRQDASFAKTLRCLWSASRLDASQGFVPSQTSFSLHLTLLLCAKWLNALLLFGQLNEEENGDTWDLHKCYSNLLFPRGDIPQLTVRSWFSSYRKQSLRSLPAPVWMDWELYRKCKIEYRLKSIRKLKPLMVIAKHFIRDGSIATCYIFQGPLSFSHGRNSVYWTPVFPSQSIAFYEGLNNLTGAHQSFQFCSIMLDLLPE